MKMNGRLMNVFCGFSIMVLFSLMAPQSEGAIESDLIIVRYQLVNQDGKGTKKRGKGWSRFKLRAVVENRGINDYTNVTANVSSRSLHVRILENTLTFGAVPAGGEVTSSDTFTIAHNHRHPFDREDLIWTFSGDPCTPLADEDTVCDGLDQDCDGLVDEDYVSESTNCGTGACASTGSASCTEGKEYNSCLPGKPMESPAELSCADSLDNDCDGNTDLSDSDCCGPLSVDDTTCDGVDDDCDGVVDEDWLAGTCSQGVCLSDEVCNGASGVSCTPGPQHELADVTCDGLDGDCDGLIDEDWEAAICGQGVCLSDEVCNGASGVTCSPGLQSEPTDVTCDGLDGDCDGIVDEDWEAATCGQGVCLSDEVCNSASGVSCSPGLQSEPTDVTCDGLDGDCDGSVDEDFLSDATDCGTGVCASTGVSSCVGGVAQDSCTPGAPAESPSELTCQDTLDNDCDGETDGADPDCVSADGPPPVRQVFGTDDTVFGDLAGGQCRSCHEEYSELYWGGISMAERHHLLVGVMIFDHSNIPYPDPLVSVYECSSCHEIVDGQPVPLIDSDCQSCHALSSEQGPSGHHRTNMAQSRHCTFCHGQSVDDYDDGHFIPYYMPSLVTPWPSRKDVDNDGVPDTGTDVDNDGIPDISSAGTYGGNCNFCHNTESGVAGTPTLDPLSGVWVYDNTTTHHVALGAETASVDKCIFCHDVLSSYDPLGQTPVSSYSIRRCQDCHGVFSLHNIQSDSDGDGVINIGRELPFYGHIGNEMDCRGCHGFSSDASQAFAASMQGAGNARAQDDGVTRAPAVTRAASVPAPPVNQNIGMLDTTFDNLPEENCRFCHNPEPPPMPVNPTYLPDRHHLNVGRPIYTEGSAPFPDADGDGNKDLYYGCLNCHSISLTGLGWEVDVSYRECRNCHIQKQDQPTVHHRTASAQAGECTPCHLDVWTGLSILSDMNDGHDVPGYLPSLVTPWPSGKTNPGAGGEGNCTFCHAAGSGDGPVWGPFTALDTSQTHHAVFNSLDPGAGKCGWCHDVNVTEAGYAIRACQNCHSVLSLHNIIYDSNGNGEKIPGEEDPSYGHIGHQDDCKGCHGFSLGENVDSGGSVNGHHLFLDTPVKEPSDRPDPGHDNPDGTYSCLSCHSFIFTGLSYKVDPNFRECGLCHPTP